VLSRLLDGSELTEFKKEYGTSLICGFGAIHGFQASNRVNPRFIYVYIHVYSIYLYAYIHIYYVYIFIYVFKKEYGTSLICGFGAIHGFQASYIYMQVSILSHLSIHVYMYTVYI